MDGSPTAAPEEADESSYVQAPTTERRTRKRTRRACDKCNVSRTRCNGDHPCGRCEEYGYECNYNRQAKKRGRVPLKQKKQTSNGVEGDIRIVPGSEDGNDDSYSQGEPTMDDIEMAEGLAQLTATRPLNIQRRESQYTKASFDPSPRTEDIDRPPVDHPTSSSLQPSDLSSRAGGGFSRRAAGFAIPPSSNGSIMGAYMGQGPLLDPNPTLNFTLPGPEEVDRPTTSSQGTECRYRCLEPLLPYIGHSFPVSVACDLFDVFLLDPGASLWRFSSPYILTRIFRRKALVGPNPRPMSPALLATILWCCAQTADISVLLVPGSRSKLTNALYELSTYLIAKRDPDRFRRSHGGLQVEYDRDAADLFPLTTGSNEPAGSIDDVLTYTLLCIGVSAGDFKSDCIKWESKAKRLALSLRLNREDAPGDYDNLPRSLAEVEAQEERRRVFWLLYALDRHLALSYNRVLQIPDAICDVYAPLPESVWENLDDINDLPPRVLGPPTIITGTGFFEWFLPLMVILGDIIEVHHRQYHPRLGSLDKKYAESIIAELIAGCEASLERLARKIRPDLNPTIPQSSSMRISNIVTGSQGEGANSSERLDINLVIAYSTFILHVLHVLFHGKWDAISMLDNEDDWITTPRFIECASHAIDASEAVADILKLDPELTFMPYLFGIYLLHGSFILLLFADRMPQLGQNQSVEQACETIIRAHEVCVVTLSTEFQRNFRRVLRSTLYNVRGTSPSGREEHRLARRQVLSLYRWTRGAKGLGI